MKDGGSAFPYEEMIVLETNGTIPTKYRSVQHPGMTLRDYFAGQALAGLLSTSQLTIQEEGGVIYEPIASVAYSYADAMLQRREQIDKE